MHMYYTKRNCVTTWIPNAFTPHLEFLEFFSSVWISLKSRLEKGNERVKANKPTLHHFFTNFLRLYETGGRRWGMSLFLFLTCKRKKSSVLTKGENKEELKCMTKELPYLKLAKIFKHQSWTVKNFPKENGWEKYKSWRSCFFLLHRGRFFILTCNLVVFYEVFPR